MWFLDGVPNFAGVHVDSCISTSIGKWTSRWYTCMYMYIYTDVCSFLLTVLNVVIPYTSVHMSIRNASLAREVLLLPVRQNYHLNNVIRFFIFSFVFCLYSLIPYVCMSMYVCMVYLNYLDFLTHILQYTSWRFILHTSIKPNSSRKCTCIRGWCSLWTLDARCSFITPWSSSGGIMVCNVYYSCLHCWTGFAKFSFGIRC